MSIRITPLSKHVGALIEGMDLRTVADDSTARAVREAFAKHHLLLIRQKDVSDEDQVRFAELFGKISIRHLRSNESGKSLTQFVSNARSDVILGDGEIVFHQDHSFYNPPLTAIILYGVQIPPSGSSTKFRNAHTMFLEFPEELKERARKVRVLHLFNYQGDYTGWQDPATAPPDSPRAWQPLVWTRPGTGEEVLWLSPLSTVGFEGIDFDGGMKLIGELRAAADAIETRHTFVHTWAPGDLVIWNNLMLQHARLPFPANEPRTLRRSAILADAAV